MSEHRITNLLAAIAAITVFGFALGLMFPLLSLLMEEAGASPAIIGLNTAMQPAGILVAGFIVPRFIQRFGAKRMVLCGAYTVAVIVLAYPFFPIFWSWFFLRFIHGFAVSILFTVSEAWIVQYAEGKYRSRILALYTSVMALSFGAGPALLAYTGTSGLLPFAIGAAALVIATLPIFVFRDSNHREDDAHAAMTTVGFARKAPVLLLAVGAFGIIDAANLGFLPVWGVKRGMTVETAALALTAFSVGNVVLQFPIGWLADHMSKRHVMIGCGIVTMIASALMPVAYGTLLLWLLILIAGASSAGIYTVSLAELGDRFKGQELMAGSASFGTMWGVGALLGALIAGSAMNRYGPDGLPYSMALVFVMLIAAIGWREVRGRR